MKHIRRMLALLLSMSMLLGFVSVARAVDNELTVKANNSTFTEVNGQVTLLFESVNDYKIDSQAGTNNGGNTSGGQTGESGDQTTPESTPDPEAKLRLSPVDANGYWCLRRRGIMGRPSPCGSPYCASAAAFTI